MFSGNAIVITIRTRFIVLSSDNPAPQLLAERFHSLNNLANSMLNKLNPLTTRNVADVIQSVFESKPGILLELIGVVKELLSQAHAQLAGSVDDELLPICCGIGIGHVVFDCQLLIGDALVESEAFTEEGIRRNCLLVVEARLLPDIYSTSETAKIKGKHVLFISENELK